MLPVVCQDSLAATLVDDGTSFLDAVSTGLPLGVDVWLDGSRSYGLLPSGPASSSVEVESAV